MEFDKSRCYSALNADELKAGDKVIVANSLYLLRQAMSNNDIKTINAIQSDDNLDRFIVDDYSDAYAFAYLVERAENCTNCEHKCEPSCSKKNWPIEAVKLFRCVNYIAEPKTAEKNCENCSRRQWCKTRQHRVDFQMSVDDYACEEWKPKTTEKCCANEKPDLVSLGNGQYAERKKYRPFKDTDELIKVWCEHKCPAHNHRERDMTMPLIWVRHKSTAKKDLIVAFNDTLFATVYAEGNMYKLFELYEFLDGSPCGVEE